MRCLIKNKYSSSCRSVNKHLEADALHPLTWPPDGSNHNQNLFSSFHHRPPLRRQVETRWNLSAIFILPNPVQLWWYWNSAIITGIFNNKRMGLSAPSHWPITRAVSMLWWQPTATDGGYLFQQLRPFVTIMAHKRIQRRNGTAHHRGSNSNIYFSSIPFFPSPIFTTDWGRGQGQRGGGNI